MIERFDEYVDRCLYDPEHGFYATRGEAGGARGDFVTSPEVGPLFGAVVARYLDEVWDDLGRPSQFTVVEAAAGRGALAKAILGTELRCVGALTYVTVERSERLRDAQHGDGAVAWRRTEILAVHVLEADRAPTERRGAGEPPDQFVGGIGRIELRKDQDVGRAVEARPGVALLEDGRHDRLRRR